MINQTHFFIKYLRIIFSCFIFRNNTSKTKKVMHETNTPLVVKDKYNSREFTDIADIR